MARRRRKARRNPVGRRRRRAHRRNPMGRRRRRRNPGEGVFARADSPAYVLPSTSTGLEGRASAAKSGKKKRKRVSKRVRNARRRRRSTSKALLKRVRSLRKRASTSPRNSLRRSVLTTQARRLSTLRRVVLKGGKLSKSPVAKAMHLKMNPGLAGVMTAAKVLIPQAAVAGVACVGTALASKKIADLITCTKDASGVVALKAGFTKADGTPTDIVKWIPALSSVGVGVGGYLLADKFAPKFKGAVAIGALVAAIVQGVNAVASTQTDPNSLVVKAKNALGLGDYTTVGMRSYAESGIFREVGDYTTVGRVFNDAGGAYSNGRPRNSFDNRTEWAANGLGVIYPDGGGAYSNNRPRNSVDNRTEWAMNGLDDTTEFAPGEGGILNGGMFRGPSTR